jgi:hypothetical protein
MAHEWVWLLHRIPPEPSALRVSVWRKLKRLGALLVHDGVWVLPATEATREHMQWLAADIVEMHGSAQVWEGRPTLSAHEQELLQYFLAQVETPYREIEAALCQPGADVEALAKRFQRVLQQDYLRSPMGGRVRDMLVGRTGPHDQEGL